MLTSSWTLFNGIGGVTESKLRERGLADWADDGCFAKACEVVPGLKTQTALRERAREALQKRDARALAQVVPVQEHWRLWPQFDEDALYLDIETNGLGSWAK